MLCIYSNGKQNLAACVPKAQVANASHYEEEIDLPEELALFDPNIVKTIMNEVCNTYFSLGYVFLHCSIGIIPHLMTGYYC